MAIQFTAIGDESAPRAWHVDARNVMEDALWQCSLFIAKLLLAYLRFCWGLAIEETQIHARINP